MPFENIFREGPPDRDQILQPLKLALCCWTSLALPIQLPSRNPPTIVPVDIRIQDASKLH